MTKEPGVRTLGRYLNKCIISITHSGYFIFRTVLIFNGHVLSMKGLFVGNGLI